MPFPWETCGFLPVQLNLVFVAPYRLMPFYDVLMFFQPAGWRAIGIHGVVARRRVPARCG